MLAAVGAGIAVIPAVLKPASAASPWLAVGAVVVCAGLGAFIDHARRRGESGLEQRDQSHKAVLNGCFSVDGRRLPRVRDVTDPTLLGVHQTAVAIEDGNVSASVPPYVARDIDEEFRQAVSQGGFVVLVGDSTAGKSRTAHEAVRAVRPADTLLIPRSRNDVPAAVQHVRQSGKPCVLWLDDLERYLGAVDGLTANHVAALRGLGRQVLVCATLRAEERSRLLDLGRSGDESNRTSEREVRQVLSLAVTLRIERRFSPAEIVSATAIAGEDPRIATAVTRASEYGIAEYLAAGPQLLSRWQDAHAPGQNPRGAALVTAAVDCRRTGLVRPLSRELLTRLHEHYLAAHGGSKLAPESLDDAFEWATEKQQATTALLHGDDANGYTVFDYLVDSVQRRTTPADRVPEECLRVMLEYADRTDLFAITNLAVDYGWYSLATVSSQAAHKLAKELAEDHPDVLKAEHNLGRVAMWTGDYRRALDSYRKVLTMRTTALGAEHMDTLATRHDYAWTLSACGEYEQSEAEYRDVIALRTKTLGELHPLTLSAQHNHAWAVFQGGDPHRARKEYQAVLAIREKVLGVGHYNTITTRHDLARIAASLGEYSQAHNAYKAVLAQRLRTLGEKHPYVLTVRHNIAELHEAQGNLELADEQFRAVLADRTSVLGADHPHTLATRIELGNVLAARGRRAESIEVLESALAACEVVHGGTHPKTTRARDALATLSA